MIPYNNSYNIQIDNSKSNNPTINTGAKRPITIIQGQAIDFYPVLPPGDHPNSDLEICITTWVCIKDI